METIKRFFTLEGLDGAGTTTQCDLLAKRFALEAVDAFLTAEPTNGPIGRLIRRILSGELPASPKTIAHLFAADRCDHLDAATTGIRARIEAGQTVVTDRYLISSLAYQSIDCGFDYVYSLNASFPVPEKVFFIAVSTETAIKRSEVRANLEIFENSPFQAAVSESYERALRWAGEAGVSVVRIDGTMDPEAINEKIWSAIAC